MEEIRIDRLTEENFLIRLLKPQENMAQKNYIFPLIHLKNRRPHIMRLDACMPRR